MKKILFSFIVLCIIVPAVASASWWNPFSWFAKKTTTPIADIQTKTENTSSETKLDITTPVSSATTEIVEEGALEQELNDALMDALKESGDQATILSFSASTNNEILHIDAKLRARSIFGGEPRLILDLGVRNQSELQFVKDPMVEANIFAKNTMQQQLINIPYTILYTLEKNRPGKNIVKIEILENSIILTFGKESGKTSAEAQNDNGPAISGYIVGTDDSIKNSITLMRMIGEEYRDSHGNSYEGVCKSPEAESAIGEIAKCEDSNTGWVAAASLSTGMYYCADSIGMARQQDENIVTGQTKCAL